ncbi:ABC transporter ATP-binding protein [Phreatobacter aquaticus]|uniref:ABC transporter ATP-binding protein n=1 Tax=Phreatobacter aquaticus TaxID=2570229 RepID=A0A4D7QPZ1_9HYPH|nr:ABC transporter ATP-binding protein [Phreatobacter aquaticus]QCK87599.1 ABC transporter ATP-binding protein [Phreatobacter aquaticus]
MLQMRGIDKAYGSVRANQGIDLDVPAGRIVGLLGENGSGKSTLMKVLFGIVRADAGTIRFSDQSLSAHTPREALAAGLGMIHQHFTLVDAMTVAENVALGWRDGGPWLKPAEIARRISEANRTYGLGVNPDDLVENLAFGQRQRVEITKAIVLGAELLILDEPTSNLSPPEVRDLLVVMHRLREQGRAVVFISHKLDEVLDICDEVVVLRDGQVAGRAPVAGATRADLARMMVGRDVTEPLVRRARVAGPTVLEARALRFAEPHRQRLNGIDLVLRRGEVLGIAGVDGNGQTELADVLAGLRSAGAGMVLLDGEEITGESVSARLARGLAYIPVDRARTSLVPAMSVADNIALREFDRAPFSHRGWLRGRALASRAAERIQRFSIKVAHGSKPARTLSGGNQQKIVLAREIGREPKVLIAHQPTWGLDPGATRFVIDQILALRDAGGAVLYLASSLEEILAISDRIAVMHGGLLSEAIERDKVDVTEIGLLMAGVGFAHGVAEAAA